MAVKVHAPEPLTWGDVFLQLGRMAVLSPLKFLGMFVVAVLTSLVAGAALGNSNLVTSVVFIAVMLFALRRPIRLVSTFIQRARARTTDTPHPEPQEPAAEETNTPAKPDSVWLGTRLDREDAPFIFGPPERFRHTYFIGRTRSGKTTLLKHLIVQEMRLGSGLSLLDPHGDAALQLLGSVPDERMEDVFYFDPTAATPLPFNPLALHYEPTKLTADLLSAFRAFVGEAGWGHRMEHLLRFAILTLLADRTPHTLADLRRILVNDTWRATLLDRIENEQLREFWQTDFPAAQASVPAVTNKLSEFLTPMSPMERLFSNPANALDFPALMNGEKIFIANLAKGALGDGPSRLLGAMIVTSIQQAALARVAIPEGERTPHFLFVDEFHNYTVSSFETILSEASKYQLYLRMANQTLGQLPSSLQTAIFGNVANLISFQVSAEDAPHLRREMHRSRIVVQLPETPDCVSLEDFVAYQKRLYRQALADKNLGMSRDEIRKVKLQQRVAAVGGFAASLAVGALHGRTQNARREEIAQTLETLDRPDLNVQALRELFPDYHFREETFPDVDDFLNLAPHHGIARIERATNVFPFQAALPDPPIPGRREEVLAAQKIPEAPPPDPIARATSSAVGSPPSRPESLLSPSPLPAKDDYTY